MSPADVVAHINSVCPDAAWTTAYGGSSSSGGGAAGNAASSGNTVNNGAAGRRAGPGMPGNPGESVSNAV